MIEQPKLSRRGFLTGAVALIAAPAIVRASNLMRIVPIAPEMAYYNPYAAYGGLTGFESIKHLLLPGLRTTMEWRANKIYGKDSLPFLKAFTD